MSKSFSKALGVISSLVQAVKNFFSKTTVDTVFDKTDKILGKVEVSMMLFGNLINELQDASTEMRTVVSECDQVITEHEILKETAVASMAKYTKATENIESIFGGKN